MRRIAARAWRGRSRAKHGHRRSDEVRCAPRELEAAIAAEHQIHEAELTLLQTQLEEQVELAAIERLIGGDL
jgi:hypothetical protein